MSLLLTAGAFAQRVESGFNSGWKFAKGQQDRTVIEPGFDDMKWKDVHLPHDWAIAGPFNPDLNGQSGKLPWQGEGWYRKTFKLDAMDQGRCVYLDFDGVMAEPKVYINGHPAGEWDYGYMAFRVDITPYVKFGSDNVVAVHADTRRHGTRWYPGAGIYRKVRMVVCDPAHVAQWGTYVTTPSVESDEAETCIRTLVENVSDKPLQVVLESVVCDPNGRAVGSLKSEAGIPAGGTNEFSQKIVVMDPVCWDVKAPQLYTLRSRVFRGGKACDETTSAFGIRTIKWTADDGFHLNGHRVQLNGVNLHHDQGPLGAALYPRALERQLEIMKDMGCNAVRCSHNMPAPELPELCDRMGILLYEECFDKWQGRNDAEFVKRQLSAMVRRDRSHPSVICWSIGNEIPQIEDGLVENSREVVKSFADHVRAIDPTRPVTQGCFVPGAVGKETTADLDFNDYHYGRGYAAARKKYPQRPSVYGESASAVSSRGFYRLPLPDKKDDFAVDTLQVDSFDRNSPRYADTPDVEFDRMEKDTYCAGEFVWTGFDYLGEPSPYDGGMVKSGAISNRQTGVSSYFGIVDLCGIPKDRYYLYRSYWAPEKTTVHILPHWNWPDRNRKTVPVYVYSNGDSAELFINGRSLGRREKITEVLPLNLALGKPSTASSEEFVKGNRVMMANDGEATTRWCTLNAITGQWWQVDLGTVQGVKLCTIRFVHGADYLLKGSEDGAAWRVLAAGRDLVPMAGADVEHEFDARARYLRLEFVNRQEAVVSIGEFAVYADLTKENEYYRIMDKYRLRWNDVGYEPGELKAVAYKNGKQIGEAVMRTADVPWRLRLSPDRQDLSATGEDLSYILVEVIDRYGVVCPLAEDLVHFEVEGPAAIAGVGNGNAQSVELFQDSSRKLFSGKAMLIVKTLEGKKGKVSIKASSDLLRSGSATLRVR